MLRILYTCICIFSVTYNPHNIKYSMPVFAQIVHNTFGGSEVICVCRGGFNAVILFFLKLYSIFYTTICHAMHEKTCVFGEIKFLADKH